MIIKCLSLWELWAWAMAEKLKLIETRSFYTHHRGWLGIHAARKDWRRAVTDSFQDEKSEKLFITMLEQKGWMPDKASYGKMVCVVDLNLVVQTELVRANLSDLELVLGNYGKGRFAWKTRKENHVDLRPFNLAVTGRQGLFNWTVPPDVEKLLSQKQPTSSTLF